MKTLVGACPDFFEWYDEAEAAWYHRTYPTMAQRHGQWLMNRLGDVRPDLYGRVTTSIVDPFYVDAKIPAFLDYLMNIWEDDK